LVFAERSEKIDHGDTEGTEKRTEGKRTRQVFSAPAWCTSFRFPPARARVQEHPDVAAICSRRAPGTGCGIRFPIHVVHGMDRSSPAVTGPEGGRGRSEDDSGDAATGSSHDTKSGDAGRDLVAFAEARHAAKEFRP
jgi:hypothetical protein